MGELQDPFLVSVHLIADPGQAMFLQRAADGVLSWLHPDLQLFRVSERASGSQRPRAKRHQSGSSQPAVAVILFLQHGDGEQILMLQRELQSPPWIYHHTEKVSAGRRATPCSQDFFTLSPGTPLWAVRHVHRGKEIVRFTVYCRYENYAHMVRLYKLLLRRRLAQKKEDFCFLVVYANVDMEVQLSFKRLPRGQSPAALEAAVMEVRVRDVGELVPLLPHPCSPISQTRWQTEDYDGNKILLQVHALHFTHMPTSCRASSSPVDPAPPTFAHRTRRHLQRTASRPRTRRADPDDWSDHPDSWSRGSDFSLPDPGSTCSSPAPRTRSRSLVPPFRLNVDALIGAEETDVDTGNKVSPLDVSVVSAYIKAGLPHTPRPMSAPPRDAHRAAENKSATLGRTPNGVFVSASGPSAAASSSDVSIGQSDSCSILSAPDEETQEEEEFYI